MTKLVDLLFDDSQSQLFGGKNNKMQQILKKEFHRYLNGI